MSERRPIRVVMVDASVADASAAISCGSIAVPILVVAAFVLRGDGSDAGSPNAVGAGLLSKFASTKATEGMDGASFGFGRITVERLALGAGGVGIAWAVRKSLRFGCGFGDEFDVFAFEVVAAIGESIRESVFVVKVEGRFGVVLAALRGFFGEARGIGGCFDGKASVEIFVVGGCGACVREELRLAVVRDADRLAIEIAGTDGVACCERIAKRADANSGLCAVLVCGAKEAFFGGGGGWECAGLESKSRARREQETSKKKVLGWSSHDEDPRCVGVG